MKKGFTLIEMIAVIGLISLIALVALPAILNQLKSKKGAVTEATEKLIFTAAEFYMDEKPVTYFKKPETYAEKADLGGYIGKDCYVYLDTLVNAGRLKSPVKDVTTSQEISLTSYVKSTINNNYDYDFFELVQPDNQNYTNVTEGCEQPD